MKEPTNGANGGTAGSSRKIGRPLSFDRDAVLEKAMLTFWRHGYETSSISELTTAMGITAPSLYAAFGSKKRLFLEAVGRYAGDPQLLADRIDNSATAYEAARAMLKAAATAFTGPTTPRGCLLASATASGSAESADVQAAVSDIRSAIAEQLRLRIVRDVATGIMPTSTDAAALAGLVIAVIQGMSVLARDGMPLVGLIAIGEASMSAWHH